MLYFWLYRDLTDTFIRCCGGGWMDGEGRLLRNSEYQGRGWVRTTVASISQKREQVYFSDILHMILYHLSIVYLFFTECIWSVYTSLSVVVLLIAIIMYCYPYVREMLSQWYFKDSSFVHIFVWAYRRVYVWRFYNFKKKLFWW